MKKRIVSLLAVLALCLTMLPMAAFAAPISWPAEGEIVTLDGKEYTYLGDVTNTGLAVGEWEVEKYGSAGIAKAGEGYVSYFVEDGMAYITVSNATISALSEDYFEGYGILVADYDAVIYGVGTNVIEASNTAIDVTGCLTLTGEFQRVKGWGSGIYCTAEWNFGEDEVSVDGGDMMINANIGEVIGIENVGIYSDISLVINGDLGDVSGGSGILSGSGLTEAAAGRQGSLTINGSIGSVAGFVDVGIQGRGDVVIGKNAVIGEIVADTAGIRVDCVTDAEWVPQDDASLTIAGTVGPIMASKIQTEEDEWIRYGIHVQGGDVVIAEGAVVGSIFGDNYGVYVEGGTFTGEARVEGAVAGGEQDIVIKEWPSNWAHVEVMDAILWELVPEELQCKYTQATTRAEYAALATCLYEKVTGSPIVLTEEEMTPFTDCDDENVAKMYKVGVVNGVGEGRYAPGNKLTREQAATMLARLADALDKPLEAADPDFADNDQIFDYAYQAVGQVQAAGIMEGKENKLFDPKGSYTREQSILTMDRLFNLIFWDNEEE